MAPALPGQVLLLAVGDQARYVTRGPVASVLGGAVLCRQVLDRRPVQDLADDLPALVRRVRQDGADAVEQVGGALVADGVLARHEHRVLRLFPRRGFAVVDHRALDAARRTLEDALRPRARPDRPAAALALLCAVSGIARHWAPPPFGHRDAAALASHLDGLRAIAGTDVAQVVLAVSDAYGRDRSGSGDGGGSHHDDGYGDSSGEGGAGVGDGGDGGGGGD